MYSNLFSSASALHVNLVCYQKFPEGNDTVVLDHSKFILCFQKPSLSKIPKVKIMLIKYVYGCQITCSKLALVLEKK